MKFIEIVLTCMGCFAICYFVAKVYFIGALRIRDKFHGRWTRLLMLYALMIPFLVFVIPIGIFGPAWISDRAELFVRSSDSTLVLIVIGAIGWAATLLAALQSKTERQYTGAIRM